ncbi:flagellar biosynthetic protein FliO [Brevibacillus ruminantium]|uniref:Flagellar biosynthetic protein FliO n=1 Tax=Brevibacillus ruminantium TaxID=2950604 RepID=A0ABY4WPD2_9BACL|nr:flagellar biosynthetic protein FliO [Brevibacillus ruminantium]USG67937.1 flagellar biosynthetic protein FliO [Brevibacillus ruminantium]
MMKLRNTRVRLVWMCCLLLLFVASLPVHVMAEGGSVADALNNGTLTSDGPAGPAEPAPIVGGDSGSMWGYLLQVIFSLGLILVLIYGLLRFLSKRQAGMSMVQGPVKVISVTPLGNGKSVQVVMIGESLYVLGVGDNVQLLHHIPAGEEADLILSETEMKAANPSLWQWLPLGRKKQKSDEYLQMSDAQGRSFEEMLRNQWGQVAQRPEQNTRWMDEQGKDRGDLK